MKFLSTGPIFFLSLALSTLCSCVPKYKGQQLTLRDNRAQPEAITVVTQETNLTYVPQNERLPSYLVINKLVRYRFSENNRQQSFARELMVSPLMHKANLVAYVEKKGKVIREYNAQKTSFNILNNKNPAAPGRMKLAIIVPFLNPGEEVVLKSTYNLMDTRSHWPLFMEEADNTLASKITIDIPYGIGLHFRTTDLGQPSELVPTTFTHENSLWKRYDNRHGQGTRYIFERNFGEQNTAKKAALRQQIFLAFDAPAQLDKKTVFENWQSVSSYLYNRIDRYDLPSNIIRDFCFAQTNNKANDVEKIGRILSFLGQDIEKYNVIETFQEQEVQPATRTFSRRAGSPLDTVILGKAMLSSLGINSDIVAVSDPDQNPRLDNFFSPALFHKVILAIYSNAATYYFDPEDQFGRFDQVPSKLQGQAALSLRNSAGSYFSLPYESPEKNRATYYYELTLNTMGTLDGSFSLSLTGIKADEAKNIISENTSTLSAATLQAQLQSPHSSLKWQKASYNQPEVEEEGAPYESSAQYDEQEQEQEVKHEQHDDIINFTGVFSPRLLARAETNGFLLPVKEIFESVILSLTDANHQRFSSLSTVEAIIHVPPTYKIAADKPLNYFIDRNGLRARFLVTHEPGSIAFKGEVMISLPIKAEDHAGLVLPEDKLSIVEIATKPEAPREASTSHPPKNS